MSKNCQKLDIFFKKCQKLSFFQKNCQWQFVLKKIKSFWQFFDSQMAIFQRVRFPEERQIVQNNRSEESLVDQVSTLSAGLRCMSSASSTVSSVRATLATGSDMFDPNTNSSEKRGWNDWNEPAEKRGEIVVIVCSFSY